MPSLQKAVRCQSWPSSSARGDGRGGPRQRPEAPASSVLLGARGGHRMGAWERVRSGGPHGCPTAPGRWRTLRLGVLAASARGEHVGSLPGGRQPAAPGGGAAGRLLARRECAPLVSGASPLPSAHCLAWVRQPRAVPRPSRPPGAPRGHRQEARRPPGQAVPGRGGPRCRLVWAGAPVPPPCRPPRTSPAAPTAPSPPCPSLPQPSRLYLVLRARSLCLSCVVLFFLTYHLNFRSTFKKFTSTRNTIDAIDFLFLFF